jgi:N,N'-diacetyllegionaminate synthase
MRTLIIAEAGVNHNGNLEIAKRLVDIAYKAGADIVKFQTFKAKNLVTRDAQKADYQISNTANNDSQFSMLSKLELSEKDHHDLLEYSNIKKIQFLSTPFDLESIDLLKSLGINIGKIPSGEITNLPYLRKMAKTFRTLILSSGMSTLDEIGDALKVIFDTGFSKENITILHCNTEYPTPMKDVNLKAMLTIGKEFGVKVGYSDHTLGIEVPVAAVALGATVIEKHFTLDKMMEGPDHIASLDPDELIAMVKTIRNIELALGSEIKTPSDSEKKNIEIGRKSIVASVPIKKGDLLIEKNLTVKRPGKGLSPMLWDEIIGKKAIKDFEVDELIQI